MAVNEHVRATVIDGLRAALTEERTDMLISELTGRLPLWLRWLPVGMILDRLLPETLINAIDGVFKREVSDADPRVG